MQNVQGSIVRSDDSIQLSVVIDIPDCQSAGRPRLLKDLSSLRRDIQETIAGISCQ